MGRATVAAAADVAVVHLAEESLTFHLVITLVRDRQFSRPALFLPSLKTPSASESIPRLEEPILDIMILPASWGTCKQRWNSLWS